MSAVVLYPEIAWVYLPGPGEGEPGFTRIGWDAADGDGSLWIDQDLATEGEPRETGILEAEHIRPLIAFLAMNPAAREEAVRLAVAQLAAGIAKTVETGGAV